VHASSCIAEAGGGGEVSDAWCFFSQEATIEAAVDEASYLSACSVSRDIALTWRAA